MANSSSQATPGIVKPAVDLVELAKRINARHQAAQKAYAQALEAYLEMGQMLQASKDAEPYGGWSAWVKAHLVIGPIQARRYLRLAREWAALRSSTIDLPDVSRSALLEELWRAVDGNSKAGPSRGRPEGQSQKATDVAPPPPAAAESPRSTVPMSSPAPRAPAPPRTAPPPRTEPNRAPAPTRAPAPRKSARGPTTFLKTLQKAREALHVRGLNELLGEADLGRVLAEIAGLVEDLTRLRQDLEVAARKER